MRYLNILFIACCSFFMQSCELFNLELQRDYEFTPAPVKQYLGVDAYEFIGSRKNIDMLYLNLMIEKVGLQDYYTASGYTFILPNDNMVSSWLTKNKKQSLDDCSEDEIKDFLLSMICIGEYLTIDLDISDTQVETLKDNSCVYLRIAEIDDVTTAKEEWYKLYINGSNCVATSNLRPTNGVIHVIETDFNRYYSSANS